MISLATISLLASSALAVGSYTFENVPLPTGAQYGFALGLSRNGQVVVGNYQRSDTRYGSFRWSPADGFTDLGYLYNGTSSAASGVSYDGLTICGQESHDSKNTSYRWRGNMYLVGGLPGATMGSLARGMSGDGKTIVGAAYTSNGAPHGFRWKPDTGSVDLPPISGHYSCTGWAVSADGRIVGGSSSQLAMYWDVNNVPHLLPAHGSDFYSEVYGVDKTGAYFVGATGPDVSHLGVCRWTPTSLLYIGKPTGQTTAYATCVSDNGTVIGVYGSPGGYFWTPQSGFVRLDTYLTAHGVNMNNFSILSIKGVSADGKTFTGHSAYNGQQFAYRATIQLPPTVTSVTFNPATILGGQTSTATVHMSANVEGDSLITLSSGNTAIATVPKTVTVKAGQSSASFIVTSSHQSVQKHLKITATRKLASVYGVLTINPNN